MIRNLILLFIILSMTSCSKNHEINQDTIGHLNVYKDATNLILENIKGINKTLDNKEKHLAMTFWSLYYFENSILPENPELKKLKSLWLNNYLSNGKVGGLIHIINDNCIGFVTFHKQGYFNSITHLLIYSKNEYQYPWPEEIIDKEKIESNWTYLVLKKYTAD